MSAIKLSKDEVAAIRRLGEGTAFIGLIDFPRNRRGRPIRGYRTGVYRRYEGAEAAMSKLQFNRACFRRVVHINTAGEVLENPTGYERAMAREQDR